MPWRFGKTFLQKYFFNFDAENKIIEYYKLYPNDNNKKEEIEDPNKNKNLYWILFAALSVFIITCIVILYFVIYKWKCLNNRKKRANELDDEFDYAQKYNEKIINNDKDDKLMIN